MHIKRSIELLDFYRIQISKVDYFPPSVVNFHGKLRFKLSAINCVNKTWLQLTMIPNWLIHRP